MALQQSFLKAFGCIISKTNAESALKHGLDLENDMLGNTDWQNSTTTYVGYLLPNFFIIYFGQKPPIGNITKDDLKMAFGNLGLGYNTWITLLEEAINTKHKIETVLDDEAAEDNYNRIAFVKKYFNKD